ncbi:asparagine synthase (glutamine-hydrolyzing) [Noviherbaspirillum massiliense]|uniref:asparagine synthase (glutamine-hydrolyzing) n=1 Tax=Noviherbaspirillum massiliense TaxID=1465823 RepID=UPI00036E97D8|nr:asparagine synthase (glutamine-hydrolyzing) [Noviherbaspirillum massiliense]
MCGIAGKIIRYDTGLDWQIALADELGPISARGPDSHGTETFYCRGFNVSLTHARLSIIDLSPASHQPMRDPVSGWWVSYNGEIYNYPEVREELQSFGWSFQSRGDTEILLKAWAQWGLDALSRFNGMFAFAAFHPESGELWLVRDRFGVKPLAWGYLPEGGIAFSSSVAAIASQVRGEIDTDYCARGVRYKVYETADSGTPFTNVHTVPAGSWTRIRISEAGPHVSEGKWYDLHKRVSLCSESIFSMADEELFERCSILLEDAVQVRLRSDVPVAVSLSGGLDSSAVAALASKHVPQLCGFTYGSPDAQASEGPDVERFSREAGVEVAYVWPRFGRKPLGDVLERTMAFQEAPFSGLSLLAQNEVYRSARQAGFKVLLGGQGGDELFAGYRKFFVVVLREALHKHELRNLLSYVCSFGLMMLHEAGQARMYWQNLNRYRSNADAGFRLLDWQPHAENLWGGRDLTLSARQIDDVRQWSLPSLLRYEDRNSMGYGVESRLPFMDYRLLELALALPARLKISKGYGKWALRKITAGTVPDAIRLNRKKRGFDVTQAWVKDGIGARLRSMIFDHRRVLADHLRQSADLDHLLSDAALSNDGNLLDEALMLAWLTKPVRVNVAEKGVARIP